MDFDCLDSIDSWIVGHLYTTYQRNFPQLFKNGCCQISLYKCIVTKQQTCCFKWRLYFNGSCLLIFSAYREALCQYYCLLFQLMTLLHKEKFCVTWVSLMEQHDVNCCPKEMVQPDELLEEYFVLNKENTPQCVSACNVFMFNFGEDDM